MPLVKLQVLIWMLRLNISTLVISHVFNVSFSVLYVFISTFFNI